MANVKTDIVWLACELIEQIPGKVSGRHIVRGTRIMPDPICEQLRSGRQHRGIQEGFPALSVAQIERWPAIF